MMTNTTPTIFPTDQQASTTGSPAQKVVVINGGTDMMALLETVLEAGHYDIVLVESTDRAYSHIKRVQPQLVILCTRLSEPDGFQVLSMLKLDEETRRIPVLTYATEFDGHEPDEDTADTSDADIFPVAKVALPMN
jgi:PleD family two-component response regulator